MPIIACSANVIRGAREACLESGMDDYIPKPTKLLALADIMHRWLPLPAKPADEPGVAGDLEAGTAAGADAPLDIRALHGLSNGDPAVEQRALAHFRRINDTDATLLLQAAERMHMASIIHLAHRIKGACKFVGAAALAAASDRLEQAAKSGAAGDIEELVKAFRTELERLNATLDAR
jgi:HPt (histidine-containing phosphotransfer) domain-containing protein